MELYKIIIVSIIILLFILLFGKRLVKRLLFNNTEYKKVSGNSYSKTFKNKGNYGEFLIYRNLMKVKGEKRILTNVYLPKSDGSTTEIDLIMINSRGIYVIESKNYGGWIYGREEDRMWLQTLNNGEKHSFYNPIFQNNTHVKALLRVLGNKYAENIFSYIVFSERCKIKKLKLRSKNHRVIKVNKIRKFIRKDNRKSKYYFDYEEINKICSELERYAMLNKREKKSHAKYIKKNYK